MNITKFGISFREEKPLYECPSLMHVLAPIMMLNTVDGFPIAPRVKHYKS